MSQLSARRRMDRVFDALLPPGSAARREHDLPDHLRAELEAWRVESSSRWENAVRLAGSRDAAFERFLDGEIISPAMSSELRDAMGLNDPLTNHGANPSDEELAAAYQRMIE